jgi:hypothetical protein
MQIVSPSARTAAAAFYRPFLLGLNGVFLLLCYLRFDQQQSNGIRTLSITTAVVWVVQYLCYQTILEDAASSPRQSTGGTSASGKPLAGGLALDALAVATLAQFVGLLWSPKAYYVLLVLPVGAAWHLLSSMRRTWSSLVPAPSSAGGGGTGTIAPGSAPRTRRGAGKRR